MSHYYFKGQRKHELTHAYEHRFYGKKPNLSKLNKDQMCLYFVRVFLRRTKCAVFCVCLWYLKSN